MTGDLPSLSELDAAIDEVDVPEHIYFDGRWWNVPSPELATRLKEKENLSSPDLPQRKTFSEVYDENARRRCQYED